MSWYHAEIFREYSEGKEGGGGDGRLVPDQSIGVTVAPWMHTIVPDNARPLTAVKIIRNRERGPTSCKMEFFQATCTSTPELQQP